ncbi:hypothetical protein [Pedobacter sp. Hv1]|uniref:hypothetical protein n=1 Tax=Pedobacter sp. Hv1 TaxID=1740090 RepID=UPI0006D89B9E|nr:hypothetical protein [Pedobacter sp. Hv1]KQC01736.1 hypothetical protein AQF98_05025 [Pedobacter sp. Hv1]
MALLLVFVFFQWFQFHHHHPSFGTSTQSSKNAQLYQKCEVCEFVLSKENSCITVSSLSAPTPTSFILIAIQFLPYQLGKTNLVAIPLDNKGPPLA